MTQSEHLSIPDDMRAEVIYRDNGVCRVCGKHLGERIGIHHVLFGGDYVGMGGRRKHDPLAMVSICWLPGDPLPHQRSCHDLVHSQKDLWIPLLLQCAATEGLTALQLRRWALRAAV
jgi:hypothetical protein